MGLKTATHTPGPWQYVFEGETTAFIVESDGSTIICIRTTKNTTAHRNLPANARLIAAAPELLATLQRLLAAESRMGGNNPLAGLCDEARDLVARATGAA